MATGVDARLLKSTKFPPEFNQKVDMQKVNLQVIKKWIASKISEILGGEDDVVIELCFGLIEGSRFPDIKGLQIQLTGFLEKETAPFCKELWKLFLSAQASPQGVPKELLEAKKLELIQEKIEADRVAEESRRRREDADRRQSQGGDPRERRDWGRGRGDPDHRGGAASIEVIELKTEDIRETVMSQIAIVALASEAAPQVVVAEVRDHRLLKVHRPENVALQVKMAQDTEVNVLLVPVPGSDLVLRPDRPSLENVQGLLQDKASQSLLAMRKIVGHDLLLEAVSRLRSEAVGHAVRTHPHRLQHPGLAAAAAIPDALQVKAVTVVPDPEVVLIIAEISLPTAARGDQDTVVIDHALYPLPAQEVIRDNDVTDAALRPALRRLDFDCNSQAQ
ncbi:Serine/arginine repetitive matrix protein 1 [Verticillium nonalfalfae]|uniref:Serine/arginine repetitive matrix protein 1 n=1 Tax=Verticillium nonalfalfae TaxID=1051616 RepID=A0A3M9Y4C0_9PEZI|nr:Serine/arginine repetitive matrix protein 1 [Verticillium nonalfalfae]RNJ54842.1 Serine/arginine repetitive matrix protein 1 [Verticillium nonalfalfae]